MSVFEMAALAAALCVAVSNIIAPAAIRHFGPFAFGRWRQVAALGALLLLTAWRGNWGAFSTAEAALLATSGLVGIVMGDTAVYAAMARLGPRRAALLYATNAPFAAVLGFLVLGETLSVARIIGIALVLTGVWLAIAYRDANTAGKWEQVHGRLSTGVALGLLGGLGQALAALMVRPVMAAGMDAAAAACVRSAAALAGLLALAALPRFRTHNPPTPGTLAVAGLSGILGMGAGMTLILFALSASPAGVVTTLASTTPVLLLPLLWMVSGTRPALPAWLGAIVVVAGVALLSLGNR